MTILDRYIGARTLSALIKTMVSLVLMFILIDLLTHRREIIARHEVPWQAGFGSLNGRNMFKRLARVLQKAGIPQSNSFWASSGTAFESYGRTSFLEESCDTFLRVLRGNRQTEKGRFDQPHAVEIDSVLVIKHPQVRAGDARQRPFRRAVERGFGDIHLLHRCGHLFDRFAIEIGLARKIKVQVSGRVEPRLLGDRADRHAVVAAT